MQMMNKRIKGIKKAVGEYQRANAGGPFSPWYGELMFDRATGEVWTDVFYNLGHNEHKVYHSPNIINLGREMWGGYTCVTMKSVREWAEHLLIQ